MKNLNTYTESQYKRKLISESLKLTITNFSDFDQSTTEQKYYLSLRTCLSYMAALVTATESHNTLYN